MEVGRLQAFLLRGKQGGGSKKRLGYFGAFSEKGRKERE